MLDTYSAAAAPSAATSGTLSGGRRNADATIVATSATIAAGSRRRARRA